MRYDVLAYIEGEYGASPAVVATWSPNDFVKYYHLPAKDDPSTKVPPNLVWAANFIQSVRAREREKTLERERAMTKAADQETTGARTAQREDPRHAPARQAIADTACSGTHIGWPSEEARSIMTNMDRDLGDFAYHLRLFPGERKDLLLDLTDDERAWLAAPPINTTGWPAEPLRLLTKGFSVFDKLRVLYIKAYIYTHTGAEKGGMVCSSETICEAIKTGSMGCLAQRYGRRDSPTRRDSPPRRNSPPRRVRPRPADR